MKILKKISKDKKGFKKLKENIFNELKILSNEFDYPLSDMNIINMTNSIIKSAGSERDKDYELSRDYSTSSIKGVDEIMLDGGWKHYCSDPVWAGLDFIESQKSKGIIKSYNDFRFNRNLGI
jgi:hypothetical protein